MTDRKVVSVNPFTRAPVFKNNSLDRRNAYNQCPRRVINHYTEISIPIPKTFQEHQYERVTILQRTTAIPLGSYIVEIPDGIYPGAWFRVRMKATELILRCPNLRKTKRTIIVDVVAT